MDLNDTLFETEILLLTNAFKYPSASSSINVLVTRLNQAI